MSLTKVDSIGEYDFYLSSAIGNKNALYNIVPKGSPAPEGGYRNMQYIEKIKGVKFPDRYQPTKHGMTNLYPRSDSESMKQNQDNINRMIQKFPTSKRDTSRGDIAYAESVQNKTLIESAERFLGEDQVLSEANISDMNLLVTHMTKEVTEDSFEEGEIGQSQLVQYEKIGKKFASFDEFKKYCEKDWGLESTEDSWVVIDNRIIYNRLEDEQGIEPYPTELTDWKQGKKKLYSASYDFLVELITSSENEDDIREWTGIKN